MDEKVIQAKTLKYLRSYSSATLLCSTVQKFSKKPMDLAEAANHAASAKMISLNIFVLFGKDTLFFLLSKQD